MNVECLVVGCTSQRCCMSGVRKRCLLRRLLLVSWTAPLACDSYDGVSTFGSLGSGRRKWIDAVQAGDGTIYGIPFDSNFLLLLDPATDETTTVALSRYVTNRTAKWTAGVLDASGGFIFGMPGTMSTVLRIDTLQGGQADFFAPDYPTGVNTYQYSFGVRSANGSIYGIPGNSGRVIRVDPWVHGQAVLLASAGPNWGYLWQSSVTTADGRIFGIPSYADSVLEIDPASDNVTTFGSLSGSSFKWLHGILAPNGAIYGIPYSASSVLKIEPGSGPARGTASTFGSLGSLAGKWRHAVLDATGVIYGIPYAATAVLRIDTWSDSVTTFGELPRLPDKWFAGVLGWNGMIYGIPSASDAVLRIDPITQKQAVLSTLGDASILGDTGTTDKWKGFVLTENGTIYALPFNAEKILRIDPSAVTSSTTATTFTFTSTATSTMISTTSVATVIALLAGAAPASVVKSPSGSGSSVVQISVGLSVGGVLGFLLLAGLAAACTAFCRRDARPWSYTTPARTPVLRRAGPEAWDDEEGKKAVGSPQAKRSSTRVAPVTKQPDSGEGDPMDAAALRGISQELLASCGCLVVDLEPELGVVPLVPWCEIEPAESCKESLAHSIRISSLVPDIGRILNDVSMKVWELNFVHSHVRLDFDCRFALAAYTHDLRSGRRAGNLHYELNRQLRQRSFFARKDALQVWGGFMFYLMRGLAQLPDWSGECFRGFPDSQPFLSQTDSGSGFYGVGKEVQWGSFVSALTSVELVKGTVERGRGLVLRLRVRSGRDIRSYAFFPVEGEILLSPEHRFVITGRPYEVDGYSFLDMEEAKGPFYDR
ncbi:unnamed protein product [Polarella glacialis]|uniref:NAD(P)(+)--arginine ADP-ribosyltransferase n=1 Tax=Polarella glacialis TaxID=89957 RepID=A0A813EBX8_POLGL|nr:unnamed protein product [Polarella glacialis]